MLRDTLRRVALCAGIAFVLMQLSRPPRTNPHSDPAGSFEAVTSPHPEFASVLRRACMDCHSNETSWLWYSNVAPASWLMSRDVIEGRAHLNLSEWSFYPPQKSRSRVAEMCAAVKNREMPLWNYTAIHPKARLSPEDVARLCQAARTERAALRLGVGMSQMVQRRR